MFYTDGVMAWCFLGQKESTSWNADDLWCYRSSFLARLVSNADQNVYLNNTAA